MKPAFKYAITTILLMLSFAAHVAAGPLKDTAAASRKGDYATALRPVRPLAEQGARVQLTLGMMYFRDQGVRTNQSEAAKLVRAEAPKWVHAPVPWVDYFFWNNPRAWKGALYWIVPIIAGLLIVLYLLHMRGK